MDIDYKVSTIENAQTVSVPLKKSGTETIMGLDKIIRKNIDNRSGYAIYAKRCEKCGTEATHSHSKLIVTDDKDKCSKCNHTKFAPIEALSPETVAGVLNTRLQYKCRTCGAIYNKPTACCNANRELKATKELQSGWYCTGCSHIYDEKVMCCNTGKMIPGQYYRATRQEYLLKPKYYMPWR